MRKNEIVLLYLCLINNILCISDGVYFPQKNNIIILTDYTFEEALNEYNYLFISVYSEICFTCINKINPSLSLLYQEIQNNEEDLKKENIIIAKIDGSYNNHFMNNYNIIGYPTIILFKDGKIISQLNNKYQLDDILIFLRKNILRPIQYINNIVQYNRLIHNSFKESFITYYGSNTIDIKSLIEISNTYKHLTFVNIYNTSIIKALNFSVGDLSLNKFFDEPMIFEKKINGDWGYDKIEKFIKKYNHKILIDFGSKEGEIFILNKKNILVLINKQELTKEQIKRSQYMEGNTIKKEIKMNNENKINQKNFVTLAKNVRDKIQSGFIIYKKNYVMNDNSQKKRRSILDEDDPFGFEYQRQQKIECEKRQIKFINKLDLDNNLNCEIRLIEFKNENKILFYKLNCGEDNIQNNIDFIEKWYNKTLITTNNDYWILDY